MKKITLTLYGTAGCHLCDQALVEIRAACTLPLSQFDIIDDEALYALYETSIPVLKIESHPKTIILNWPFNRLQIENALNTLVI